MRVCKKTLLLAIKMRTAHCESISLPCQATCRSWKACHEEGMQNGQELYLPNVIVVGVMAWCDLQRSRPKLSIYILVSNDGDPPAQLMTVVRVLRPERSKQYHSITASCCWSRILENITHSSAGIPRKRLAQSYMDNPKYTIPEEGNNGAVLHWQAINHLPPLIGTSHSFPTRWAYLSSSGCTATAVSPRIVSGRVVATGRCSSDPTTGYLKKYSVPGSSV